MKELRARAKRQKVASDFPEVMSEGEIVSIYRNLSMQEWTTLPDEVWMRGVKVATERAADRREAAAKREEAQRQARTRSPRAQAASENPNSSVDADELERKRQERRKARRAAAKKKKR